MYIYAAIVIATLYNKESYSLGIVTEEWLKMQPESKNGTRLPREIG